MTWANGREVRSNPSQDEDQGVSLDQGDLPGFCYSFDLLLEEATWGPRKEHNRCLHVGTSRLAPRCQHLLGVTGAGLGGSAIQARDAVTSSPRPGHAGHNR